MLDNTIYSKNIPFSTVLFDTWYAPHKIMAHIDSLNKIYYAPLKANRNVTKVNSDKNISMSVQFLCLIMKRKMEL